MFDTFLTDCMAARKVPEKPLLEKATEDLALSLQRSESRSCAPDGYRSVTDDRGFELFQVDDDHSAREDFGNGLRPW